MEDEIIDVEPLDAESEEVDEEEGAAFEFDDLPNLFHMTIPSNKLTAFKMFCKYWNIPAVQLKGSSSLGVEVALVCEGDEIGYLGNKFDVEFELADLTLPDEKKVSQ